MKTRISWYEKLAEEEVLDFGEKIGDIREWDYDCERISVGETIHIGWRGKGDEPLIASFYVVTSCISFVLGEERSKKGHAVQFIEIAPFEQDDADVVVKLNAN